MKRELRSLISRLFGFWTCETPGQKSRVLNGLYARWRGGAVCECKLKLAKLIQNTEFFVSYTVDIWSLARKQLISAIIVVDYISALVSQTRAPVDRMNRTNGNLYGSQMRLYHRLGHLGNFLSWPREHPLYWFSRIDNRVSMQFQRLHIISCVETAGGWSGHLESYSPLICISWWWWYIDGALFYRDFQREVAHHIAITQFVIFVMWV